MGQVESMRQDLGASGRSVADVATLLLELGRASKGWAFYPPEHPARAELLDRTFRAWQGELRRGGPLELSIRRGAFWIPGAESPLTTRADDTARQLYLRSVRRVIFDAELDPASLAAFLDVVTMEPETLSLHGGFETVLYTAPRHGIQVNEADWRALLDQPPVEDTLEVDDEELANTAPLGLGEEPAAAGVSAVESGLALLGAAVQAAEDADEAPIDPATARRHELESILSQIDE